MADSSSQVAMEVDGFFSGGGSGLSRDPLTGRPRCSNERDEMYEIFQSWALQNYGDSGKTKTVTRRKYSRIVQILSGEEPATSDNSKFRFWVKAKGFRLGATSHGEGTGAEQVLYIPTKSSEQEDGEGNYKRVAIVEDFFEIIYNVHVEMDGRGGKHAGQKRTYRAIAETYSFLPREAVTRFLMSCSDCQKRMHLSMETNNNGNTPESHVTDDPPIIDFSLPITTAYLNHMKTKKGFLDENYVYHADGEESMSSRGSHTASVDHSPSPINLAADHNISPKLDDGPVQAELADVAETKPIKIQVDLQNRICPGMTEKDVADDSVVMAERNGNGMAEPEEKPLNMVAPVREDKGHPERKRRASDDSIDSSTKASESAADDAKDDDDENDDEEDEKLQSRDPERLKSFNMFCRLFVDENLDRSVPISKQPKDKIQAILEACDRQFPEFHERSRKRIRTYLKSCRRMRRSKEANGWEQLRPTPPHLTSAAAESILAQACENESNNAKRMRMGLDPLPANVMCTGNHLSSSSTVTPSKSPQVSPSSSLKQPREHVAVQQASPNGHGQTDRQTPVGSGSDFMRHAPPSAPTAFRPPHELPSPFFTNSNGIFRPGFPSATYQHPAHHHPPTIQHATPLATQIQNGPTDLSMKSGGKSSTTGSKNQLNQTEVATIKQLIAGYRESAAFLYRSADELEQLLLQQN